MKIKLLILLLSLNLFACKNFQHKTETKKTSSEIEKSEPQQLFTGFDFSSVDKFRNTKNKGLIVNDYDSIFSPAQRQELTDLLYNYDKNTTRQIVIVTIDDISPYSDIHKFATDLGNYWGVGQAEKNNGLVLLVCKPCRQVTIATGNGTEKVLTDDICQNVINEKIIPEFKKGDFYNGIKKGVEELIEKWH